MVRFWIYFLGGANMLCLGLDIDMKEEECQG